jgi:hypothetical protein
VPDKKHSAKPPALGKEPNSGSIYICVWRKLSHSQSTVAVESFQRTLDKSELKKGKEKAIV